MDVDENLLRLIGALKSVPGCEGENRERLIQNINNCFSQIKKDKKSTNTSATQSPGELQEFQLKALVVLLLCVPNIQQHPNLINSVDFQSLTLSLPELPGQVLFTVIRTQKIFLLSPVLSWLPVHIIQSLNTEFYACIKEVTPVTLMISVEILRALLYSSQTNDIDSKHSAVITEPLLGLVKFFSSKSMCAETPAMVKFSGYLFMYLCESLYLLMTAYVGDKIKEPETLAGVEPWKKLWEKKNLGGECRSLSCTKDIINSILGLCQSCNREVTVDMWMEWSEQMLPLTVTLHPGSSITHGKGRSKSIQLVICNIAFDVLRILEHHPGLKEDLGRTDTDELLEFFHQVSVDPDHDPDKDLDLEQLVEEIKLGDDRQGKLLGLLVHHEGIFTSDTTSNCLKEYASAVDSQTRRHLLEICIDRIKAEKPCNLELKNVALDLASDMNLEQLRTIIEGSLSSGLDDSLKTTLFKTHLTAVFNQMADESCCEPTGRHVWLCLQSGREVVEEAVCLAITMTGLVPAMTQALVDLPYVCHAVLPSGVSLLVSTLVQWQNSDLSERRRHQFIALVKSLLSEERVLNKDEVLLQMVEPYLLLEQKTPYDKLFIPLEILKALVGECGGVVVRQGPALVAVILALTHILDATVCLKEREAADLLALRSLATGILHVITNAMANQKDKFEREISLLKQVVCEHKLHPWSVAHLNNLLDAEFCDESGADILLFVFSKMSESHQREVPPGHLAATVVAECAGIKMSKPQWIISLLQVLPHCSENEWQASFFLTDQVLGPQQSMFSVMEVFLDLLHLMCESLSATHPHGSQSCRPPLSLSHIFVFFAAAAMNYLKEKCCEEYPLEMFCKYASIFRWWCCSIPYLACDPELPTLFLAKVCSAIEELVISGKLKVDKEFYLAEDHYNTGEGVNKNGSNIRTNVELRESEQNNEDRQVYRELGTHMQKLDYKEEERDSYENEGDILVRQKVANENKDKAKQDYEKIDTSGRGDVGDEVECSDSRRTSASIKASDLKCEIEHMTLCILKYVPSSNLLSSVCSKFKILYES